MTPIFDPTGKRRRLALLGVIFSVTTLLALILVPAAFAVLSGSPSKFESGNDPTLGLGNMVPGPYGVAGSTNADGDNDWSTVDFTPLPDLSNSNADDSFTPGQKQDTVCPTVAGHKNPPKDDFTDVASFIEGGNADPTFLYGATIRYAANGNASENIELKQGTNTTVDCGAGLLARTAGDKLIAIDYLGGGSAVQFHVLTWVDSGACFVANDPAPCWGATVQTLGANFAEGGVNGSAITALNNPINGKALVAGMFAEFGVNLAGAGIIPVGSCKTFSQTVWESRSSGSSFVSSTKDIVVEDKDINSCSTLTITKVGSDEATNPGSQEGAVFSLYEGSDTTGTLVGTCTIDANGDCQDPFSGLNTGTYTLAETGTPTGYGVDPLLTSNVAGDGYTFQVTAGTNVSLSFTDPALRGAIEITKTGKDANCTGDPLPAGCAGDKTAALDGVGFELWQDTNGVDGLQTTADNSVDPAIPADTQIGTEQTTALNTDQNAASTCFDGLAYGDYIVHESTAPTGYSGGADQVQTINANADCAGDTGTPVSMSFSNTPLTDVVITSTGEAAAGTTDSQITCVVGTAGANIGDSPSDNTDPASVTATGLEPGTYTCTVVIDP